MYPIKGVQVSVWSAADIMRHAALDLTALSTKSNLNVFQDPHFGTIDQRVPCYECRQSAATCSGHFCAIQLGTPIPNPLFIKDIKNILQCFCRKCSSLLYERERIELNNFHMLEGSERIKRICDILTKTKGTFYCPKCNQTVNEIIVIDDKTFWVRYPDETVKKGKKKMQLEYQDIYNMFLNISNEDLQTLGFNENLIDDPLYKDPKTFSYSVQQHRHMNRPEDLFLTVLPVLPICIRPCVAIGKEIRHDGATILYQLILKAVKSFKDAKNEEAATAARDIIQKHIFSLFKQKNDDTNKKSYNSMCNRLGGKGGHFRASVEAKRADFGGRTVVGNAPYLPFQCAELPQEMTKISQIEHIFSVNIDYWNNVLQEDKRLYKLAEDNYTRLCRMPKQPVYLTREPFTHYEPIIQYVVRDGKKSSFKFINKLQNGDIIHRKLRTGDMIIVNRQPTIRKENFNAHRIVVCPLPQKRTMCIPLPCCQSYNMDFDGDEGNCHVPQGPRCQAEMEVQMNMENKIMTDQTSTNVINLVQGVVYCLYLLTRDDYFVPWHLFCDYAFIVECWDWQDVLYRANTYFTFDKQRIPGKVVFSLLLPKEYTRQMGKEDTKITIENGILTSGQLVKKTMNKIIEDLYIEFSHQHAVDYINHANFLANKLNTIRGYTFSRTDCLNTQQDKIDECLKDTFKEVKYIETIPIDKAEKNVMIREVLDKATQIGQRISKDGMVGGELNAMSIATRSEAKGSMVNLSYISCFLGLQTVLGDHYKPELCEGTRVSPCFDFYDESPRAKGFITSNFYKGLDPIELFFHAWSSRKGLIDTAVTTRTSGYTHRKFGKKMENSNLDNACVIRNCDGSIIDFVYGEFGFDAAEVYWTGGTPFFTDIKQLVSRINNEFLQSGGYKDTPRFKFGPNEYEYLARQLIVPAAYTEPVDAMKRRIMYVIKKDLAGVEMYLDKWCIFEFMKRTREQFNRSRAQPGNMVGFKATCAIGSVSTQDALNAFHASGTSSKATTTGLPRLEELTNLTATPKVTGGSFRYNDEILNSTMEDKVELKKLKMRRVEELRRIFEYKTFGDFCTFEIVKTSDSVTNEWESLLDIHETGELPAWSDKWFEIMDIEKPEDYEGGFWVKCILRKDIQYRYRMSIQELYEKIQGMGLVVCSPPSIGEIYVMPNYDNADVPKNIDTEKDTWKYYWTRDIFVDQLMSVYICGIYNIQKIFYSSENIIDYQGHNFKELMMVENIIFSSLHTDVIWEVVEFLGIHAAYHFLYEELSKTLSKQLNPSHIMLLGRTMTNEGFLTNVTRNGINRKVGVLTKASFETPVDNFITAAIWGENDRSTSLASSYFLGVPGKYGTRYDNFALLDHRRNVCE